MSGKSIVPVDPSFELQKRPGYVVFAERAVTLDGFAEIFGLGLRGDQAPTDLNHAEIPGGGTLFRVLVLLNPETGHKFLALGFEGYHSIKTRVDGTGPTYTSLAFFPAVEHGEDGATKGLT